MLSTDLKIGKIKYNGKNVNLFAGKTNTQSGATVIKVADLAGVTFQLLDVDLNVLQTATTTASKHSISFSVSSTGVYFVKNVTKDWIKSVEVKDIGVWYVAKDDILQTYTQDELSQICSEGLASTMFTPGSELLIEDANSIYNNKYIFIEYIEALDDGSEQIHFRLSNYYTGSTYNINPQYSYLKTNTATSFTTSQYSSEGGFKYSAMRQRMQAQGEETWSQATGIIPDTSTISTGIKFSELFYTDGNGKTSGLYEYDQANDDMILLEEFPETQTQYVALFVKGYFKSVGKITQDVFNSGYYYTFASNVYTRATTWSSSTTYYGFYETLQEDGIFYAGFKSTFGSHIVNKEMTGSAGRNTTTNLQTFSDPTNINSIEELFGLNRNDKLVNGTAATSANFYNIEGEGEKYDVYNYENRTLGDTYWTRSVYSNISLYFCYVSSNGGCGNNYVNFTYRVRPGFIFR